MSWIKEVIEEIKNLDTSKKSLKKFGITMGAVLFLFSGWLIFRKSFSFLRSIIFGSGIFLVISGAFYPGILRGVYRVWMGIAFLLGSIVSRLILLLLFYFVITPLGLIARVMGKNFLDLEFDKKKNSYWINKDKTVNYEKMY
ncbi:MAG: hypothetical protein HYS07_04695 [Chlamydiae bacterium]|nr:hypothetical protein [Chlamydiota bacterium]MBI3276188.1 hypothetical protein [Chlamydiota bacterium]